MSIPPLMMSVLSMWWCLTLIFMTSTNVCLCQLRHGKFLGLMMIEQFWIIITAISQKSNFKCMMNYPSCDGCFQTITMNAQKMCSILQVDFFQVPEWCGCCVCDGKCDTDRSSILSFICIEWQPNRMRPDEGGRRLMLVSFNSLLHWSEKEVRLW